MDSNDAVLNISPALYEQILGEKCDHVFENSSFSRKKGQVYSCGINGEILPYQQRIQAIEELYRAFLRCKNINLAKETYLLIDNTLPIANHKKMMKAMELLRLKDEIPLKEYEAHFKDEVRIARTMLWLENITLRLKEIETEEQWKEFLSKVVKTKENNEQ